MKENGAGSAALIVRTREREIGATVFRAPDRRTAWNLRRLPASNRNGGMRQYKAPATCAVRLNNKGRRALHGHGKDSRCTRDQRDPIQVSRRCLALRLYRAFALLHCKMTATVNGCKVQGFRGSRRPRAPPSAGTGPALEKAGFFVLVPRQGNAPGLGWSTEPTGENIQGENPK